jgi:hypothetical protein
MTCRFRPLPTNSCPFTFTGRLWAAFYFRENDRDRRRGGNVGISPAVWRDFQGARGKGGKAAFGFPCFPQPRHFHRDLVVALMRDCEQILADCLERFDGCLAAYGMQPSGTDAPFRKLGLLSVTNTGASNLLYVLLDCQPT